MEGGFGQKKNGGAPLRAAIEQNPFYRMKQNCMLNSVCSYTAIGRAFRSLNRIFLRLK